MTLYTDAIYVKISKASSVTYLPIITINLLQGAKRKF